MAQAIRLAEHVDVDAFTPAQRRVMFRVLRGMTAKEIAHDLDVGTKTVRWHMECIYERTGAHGLSRLHAWALRHRECCNIESLMADANAARGRK